MSSYITDPEFAEIRGIIQNVTDTFHQKPIVYIIKGESLDINNEDRTDHAETRYNLMGLVVWGTTERDAEVKQSGLGNLDISKGYVNFNYDDCQAVGLISNHQFIGQEEKDYLEFDNTRYRIIGIPPAGQLKDTNSIIKVLFQKIIHGGS